MKKKVIYGSGQRTAAKDLKKKREKNMFPLPIKVIKKRKNIYSDDRTTISKSFFLKKEKIN